ncbi:MAG: ribosomal protein S18-alanine N-acetyltransferase, partial [Chloroflexota bacterium]|nr:ribosomal protein S18-alanine N-acetyltransferase [Chloroflexota bacterium]
MNDVRSIASMAQRMLRSYEPAESSAWGQPLPYDERTGDMVYRIDPMTLADVTEVSQIEQRCFSNPWPRAAYRRELRAPDQNAYFVLRRVDTPHQNAHDISLEHPSGERGRFSPRLSLPLRALGWRPESNGKATSELIGFAGMWIVFDEAHITTIGVDPAHRGRGLGELLLVALVDDAIRRGANSMTLEVRVSNEAAQSLYRKYGFSVRGVRRRYYS